MATEYGSLPFPEAIEYLRRKIDLPTDHWDDIAGQAHDQYFTVAGATKADLLKDLHEAVRKGIAEGTTLEQFRKDFDRAVAKHGWEDFTGSDTPGGIAWRTEVIYGTNLRTAYAAGRYDQMRAVAKDRPYLRYHHNDTVITPRPEHLAWDGLILKADDPWWQTHLPPNGWGCRCWIESLSQRDLDREGKTGPDQAPPSPIDPKTGTPVGIDKGWDHAPGATRDLTAELAEKADKLPGQIGDDLKADLVKASQPAAQPVAVPPKATPAPDLFATAPGVTGEILAKKLAEIGGDRYQQLADFLGRHQVKSLFLSPSETKRGSDAFRAVAGRVKEFLGPGTGPDDFANVHGRANGYTSPEWRHVVVRAAKSVQLGKANRDKVSGTVRSAMEKIAKAEIDHPDNGAPWERHAALHRRIKAWPWTLSSEVADDAASKTLLIWLHEIGHQVHYLVGRPGRPRGARALTRYGTTNDAEWHAEHWAAWFSDRAALGEWNPEIAAYFDDLMAKAVEARP